MYELRIELGPVGARIPAGSRLRLDVSSSDFPQWDRNLNSGGTPLAESALAAAPATQTVLHDAEHPTRITLPVCRTAAVRGALSGTSVCELTPAVEWLQPSEETPCAQPA